MSTRSVRQCRFFLGASLLAPALLVGCGSSGDYSDQLAADVRSNPTPELDTLYQRHQDIENSISLTTDENWRMFTQDMGRFWLLDRPSLMTPEPVPR